MVLSEINGNHDINVNAKTTEQSRSGPEGTWVQGGGLARNSLLS